MHKLRICFSTHRSILLLTVALLMDIIMINNLAKIRKSKGQTQQEVADYLNVRRSTYGHWESGKRPMTVISVLHLMNYWEVEFSDLFEIESKDFDELFTSKCVFWKG